MSPIHPYQRFCPKCGWGPFDNDEGTCTNPGCELHWSYGIADPDHGRRFREVRAAELGVTLPEGAERVRVGAPSRDGRRSPMGEDLTMTSTIDITTICPECGQDHPVSQSHRRRGRYLCTEGTNAGGPHRFVLISTTGEMVAEADTIEEGVAAAEYLTGEQGRTILCVEAGAWEERLAIVRDLTRKRARMADGIHYAGLAGMPAEPINSARVDLLDEIVMALSIWTPTAEVIS